MYQSALTKLNYRIFKTPHDFTAKSDEIFCEARWRFHMHYNLLVLRTLTSRHLILGSIDWLRPLRHHIRFHALKKPLNGGAECIRC